MAEIMPQGVQLRDLDDIDATRDAIYDSTLKAFQQLPPVNNNRYQLDLSDIGYQGRDRYSRAEENRAILEGRSLHRRLSGTWNFRDPTGKVLESKRLTLANVPYMTSLGTFINNGSEYNLCLHGDVKVWTEQGMLPIREIVSKRLAVRVWSYDFTTNSFVLKPVTGWFKNPVRDGMGHAKFRHVGRLSGQFPKFTPQTLWATPGHSVYQLDGSKQPIATASQLVAVEETLSYTQEQLVYGTMLGDAHIRNDGLYQALHGLPQRDYVAMQRQILSTITTEQLKIRTSKKGHTNIRFRTRAHIALHNARQLFYAGRRKIVTQEALDRIDAMGLAFWFSDDGAAKYTRTTNHVVVSMHTQGFSRAEIDMLQAWLLSKWQLHSYTNRDEVRYAGRDMGWIIHLSGDSAEQLLDMVAPYLHPCLHYKLLPRPRTHQCECGAEIAKVRHICNTCLLARERLQGEATLSKSARRRFGTTATIRTMFATGTVPPEANGTERWEARMATAGSMIAAMQQDVQLGHRLVNVPCEYRENTGRRWEQAKYAYDICVDDTHNYVANGMLVSNSNQLRLRPGVYAREKETGELESHVNVARGFGHRYFLDPATGVFRIQLAQSRMPLVPLLKTLGATDDQIRSAWGNELWSANVAKHDPTVLRKIYQKIYQGKAPGDEQSMADAVRKSFNDIELDPEVTQQTLGKPYAKLNVDAILDATKKLLAVQRGEADTDDRDAMHYQKIMTADDLFADRVKQAKKVMYSQLWKMTNQGNLNRMPPALFDKLLRGTILDSGLGQVLEEINTGEILDRRMAVTRMGEGGIGSSDSIPDDARMVKPSQFGFIDPVQTPECYDAATEVMTDAGWMPWAAVTEDTAFACLIDGQLEFHKAQQLYVSDYTGLMYGAKSAYAEYLVTPNHRMWVRPYAKGDPQYRIETADRTHMRPRKLLCGGHSPYRGNSQATFSLPTITRGGNAQITAAPVATADFAEFLGWFLGEGHVEYKESTSSYQVKITQSMTANPENCSRIAGLLDRIGWSWNYSHNAFAISFKQLAAYLVEFGGSASRCIPVEVFHWPIEARQRLFESLMLAEGRKAKSGVRRCFCSTSHQLALDVQRLVFGLGKSSRLVFEPDDREQANYGGCWVLHVHDRAERIFRKTMRAADSGYYTTHYSGKIYCATVPGGLLYVRRNGLSGVWCGNSNRIGVDGRLTFQTKKGSDGRLYSRFIDAKTGDTQWLSPQDVSNKVVAFPGELQRNQPFVRVLDKGQLRQVPREAVDIALASGSDAFGPMANLIPLKSGIFPQRASMGSRMTTQALALTDAEAPYVQNKVNGQEMSFEKLYGQALGAMVSKTPGTVLSVSPLEIKVRGADGKIQTHELYNNRIFNRKSYLHNTPVVQPGQQIEAGQLLAKSNFTDSTGTAAFGKNARVAFIPNGHNFEDAIVVSEGFAKRMMSEHAYQFDADKEDNITISKNKFVSIFPGKYSRKLLENFDDDGVIRPGTKVNYNDPLILAVKQATVGPRLGRRQSSFREADTTWDHHQPGIVTDVVKTKAGVNVVVKGQQELQVGDKLCYDPETEVLTRRGWLRIADVTLADEIATLNPQTDRLEYQRPTHLHAYQHDGDMYRLETKHVDMLVTPNHNLWVSRPGEAYQAVEAREFYRSKGAWQFKKDCQWVGQEQAWMEFPATARHTSRDQSMRRVPMDIWLEFLGYYISEGSCCHNPANGAYEVRVSQFKTSSHWQSIKDCLDQLGLRYRYTEKDKRFVIVSKWLFSVLEPLGDSYSKCVPAYVGELTPRQITIFLDTYLNGDGHRGACHEYGSSSLQLVEDIGILCFKLGWCVSVKPTKMPVDKWRKSPFWKGRINKKHLRPWWKKSRAAAYASVNEGMQPYAGSVYCVTVPNHVIYVRRNTKSYWSLNSGRYGNKGVVAQIVPDGQMPQGRDGRPYEVLYNPLGTISRGNPGAILEAALGKIAETTGKPYNISDFDNIEDLADFVGQEMRKHGVDDLEDLFDPKTGRKIKQVNTGNSYIMKLHHTAEAKAQGRAIGGYSAEGTPAKGGPSGAKRVGMLDLWALLSHGAYDVIRDASVVRGQRNEEMWRQYMSGYTAPPLKIPFVYEKFMNELRAMGINPVRQGTRTQVMALRDSDIDTLAEGREIKSKETVDWDTDRLAPKKGGLFDEGLTGGHGGKKWSFIKLHEPLPNPLFEEPIKKVLGLTQKEYESVLAGTGTPNPLPKGGLAEFSPNNTGPAALQKALQNLNLDKEINRAQLEMHGTRKTARDAAIKRIGFLKSAKQVNVHPSEWIMSKVPVLPPIFRPVTTMSTSKMPLVADPNYMYRDLIEANENLQQLSGKVDDTSEERLALYNTFKALTGLGDPIKPQTQKDKVKGILKHIIGSSPKFGSMQRKLLGSTVDLVGRATIIPNPALDMDQIGIPIEEAWTMYKPFIVRRLVRQGMKHVQALDEVEKRSAVSEKAMLAEMDDRPIMANRAPVLHRYGIMAFKPVPVKGKTLQMPLLVYSGFGADNDGDAMQFHVIHDDSAAKEALDKMLPSRNLISPANFKVHQLPVQEYVAGLHAMTAGESNTPVRTFRSKADAIAAYRRGEINLDQRVQIHDD